MRRTCVQTLKRLVTGALATVALPAGALADPPDCPDVGRIRTLAVHDDGACVQELADGVYAIIHADATDEWPHSNTGVIEGRRSLFVIDSTYLPSRARADIALIRQITDKPVAYLTTTHWHMDHNNGASAYLEAFPDLTYLVEETTAGKMTLNQRWYAKFSTAEGGARREALAALERSLATGLDEEGAPLTEDERAHIEALLPRRAGELEELDALDVIDPTETFTQGRTLRFEGRRIEIRPMGRANSPSDTVFYLPRENVLFAGDILVESPLPYTGASYPVEWAPVLRTLETLPVDAVVPGHGPVRADHAYTAQVRALMETAVARVTAGLEEGWSQDQMQERVSFDDLRSGAWAEASDEDWAYVTSALVGRAWQNVRGQEY